MHDKIGTKWADEFIVDSHVSALLGAAPSAAADRRAAAPPPALVLPLDELEHFRRRVFQTLVALPADHVGDGGLVGGGGDVAPAVLRLQERRGGEALVQPRLLL